jgi:cell division protein FtsI (penicillin-binding protein 3)
VRVPRTSPRSRQGDTPPPRPPSDTGRRVTAVIVAVSVAGTLLIGFLVRLQLVDPGRYVARGVNQRLVKTPLLAMRGSIVDRHGDVFAMSLPAKAVVVNPRLVTDAPKEAAALAMLLGLDETSVQRTFEQPDTGFAYVARQLDPEVGDTVTKAMLAHPSDFAGVSVVDETKRVDAPDDLGMSVVGRMDPFGERASFGLESQFDSDLTGHNGDRSAERGGDGTTIVGTEHITSTPVQGDEITLTLDRSLQYWAETVLESQVAAVQAAGGTVIVGRPSTGEILAMASVVNDGTQVRGSKLNLAVRTYEPGSVMKVVTAAGAFQQNLVQLDTPFTVPGKLKVADKWVGDAEAHRTETMTVQDIIAQSSNVGTIKIAQLLGQQQILHYLDAFGLGKMTALGLDKEQAGSFRRKWYGSDIGSIPIGQSITATPLQIWSVYNTIANGGTYVSPKLIDKITSASGVVTHPSEPAPHQVISPEAASKVRAALEQVIEEGTGKKWQIPGYNIAAKTGTSYQPLGNGQGYGTGGNRHYSASFAGFFPATNPQISIMVMIDNPDYANHFGAQAAGPVFDRLAKETMRRYAIAPDGTMPGPGSKPVRSKAATEPPPPTTIPPTAPTPAANAPDAATPPGSTPTPSASETTTTVVPPTSARDPGG